MRKLQRTHHSETLPTEPLINLTPLIDVVFVVLISFILIAPFLQIDQITLAPGNVGQPPISTSSSIIFTIQADNTLWYNGQTLPFSQLESLLSHIRQENPSSIPRVVPDAHSHFATYQQLKNALENAGFTRMEVLLNTQS